MNVIRWLATRSCSPIDVVVVGLTILQFDRGNYVLGYFVCIVGTIASKGIEKALSNG